MNNATSSELSDAPGLQRAFADAYPELRRRAQAIMNQERDDHTLTATALVNEAYLRLTDQRNLQEAEQSLVVRSCVTAMRRVLVDHARGRDRIKRGGHQTPVTLTTQMIDGRARELDMLDLNAALDELATVDARAAQGVELRFIGGLDLIEVARVLGISERTAQLDWSFAKAWLAMRLGEQNG